MPWIKILTTLRNHPKLEVTAKDLRLPAVHLRGHLLTLWLGTLELAEDGDLSRYDDEMIASLAEYKGDADHFVQTLTDRGWLEDRAVHDWLDYVGDYLTSKYKSRRRDILDSIWQKHGRVYGGGKELGSKREGVGKELGSKWEVQDKSKKLHTQASEELLEIGREIIGLTCDRMMDDWVNAWHDDWCILALDKCRVKGMKGTEASFYAQGILRSWAAKGGPEKREARRDSVPPIPEKHGLSLREIMIQQGIAPDAG